VRERRTPQLQIKGQLRALADLSFWERAPVPTAGGRGWGALQLRYRREGLSWELNYVTDHYRGLTTPVSEWKCTEATFTNICYDYSKIFNIIAIFVSLLTYILRHLSAAINIYETVNKNLVNFVLSLKLFFCLRSKQKDCRYFMQQFLKPCVHFRT
jgi:hypothetical protein